MEDNEVRISREELVAHQAELRTALDGMNSVAQDMSEGQRQAYNYHLLKLRALLMSGGPLLEMAMTALVTEHNLLDVTQQIAALDARAAEAMATQIVH